MLTIVLLSIASFLLFYFVINLYPGIDIYRMFSDIFKHNNFAFSLFFMGVSLVMVDIGLHHAQSGIKFMIDQREFEREQERLKKLKNDSAVLKRRVTHHSYRGYAFSGEAGNDPLIVESLSNPSPKSSFLKFFNNKENR